ncbi:MAG: hypothetical protein JW730_19085 [Anaerolineales bacterium]|nr:hypothetical protein [Anaerolineales bacterium]
MKSTFYFPLLALFVMAVSAPFNARPVQAQSGIELENVGASHRFGEGITFIATIRASIPIQSVAIVISDETQGINHVETLAVQADGRTEFHLDTSRSSLRPFSLLKWNYQITLADGSVAQSESAFIRYTDNRFDWQTLESGTLRVNWYNADTNFGQAVLNAAQAGLGSISQLMAVDLAQPIEIFVYNSTDDLRGTLALGGAGWVAGHADPALGVLMVVVEPGPQQGITMEQRIPHELMHVMIYRAVGTGYPNIPAWLREGMATLAETYPNADYDRVLADASAGNRLIPLRDLCVSFPADAGQAFLAYAEARSFTNYLYRTYGSTGLLSLIASYASGVDCEHGTERAFGMPLANLEMNWRASVLGQNTFLPALQNISPYLVLLCLILIIPFIGILITLRKKGSDNEPESHT